MPKIIDNASTFLNPEIYEKLSTETLGTIVEMDVPYPIADLINPAFEALVENYSKFVDLSYPEVFDPKYDTDLKQKICWFIRRLECFESIAVDVGIFSWRKAVGSDTAKVTAQVDIKIFFDPDKVKSWDEKA